MRNNKIKNKVVAAALIGLGAGASSSLADNPGGWEYSVAPLYVWAKNIEGSSSLGGKEAPLSLDFQDDILENLDAAFAIHFEMTQGDLTLFAEYNYAKLDPSVEESIGPITIEADVEFKDTMGELGVAYAFWNSDASRWEVLGGLRYMDQELEVEPAIRDFPPNFPDKVEGGDDWWHGFGGFRFTTELSERWSFRARADYGYKDTDNKALHGMAFFDYRFRQWGSFFAGYRYLDVQYENGKSDVTQYGFDADQQGPILGLGLYF